MDEDCKQQAGGVNRDMALAALDLFGRIVTARPPHMGCLPSSAFQVVMPGLLGVLDPGSSPFPPCGADGRITSHPVERQGLGP